MAGHRVVVTWRTTEPKDFPAFRCDLADEASVNTAFDAIEASHGPIGALVANAGTAERNLAIRMARGSFAEVVQTNLIGSFHVAQRAAQSMLQARIAGRLVFISSVSGNFGTPGVSSYAASKAGLTGLARSLARELGSRGITANVVVPGLLENMAPTAPGSTQWLADTPMQRSGTLREAAAVVRFLCSDDASFITGAVLPVDGGFAMGIG